MVMESVKYPSLKYIFTFKGRGLINPKYLLSLQRLFSFVILSLNIEGFLLSEKLSLALSLSLFPELH